MRSDIKESERTDSYPLLKKFKTEKGCFVVLFIERHRGTVVWENYSADSIRIGVYADDWLERQFEVFDGIVELEN